MSLKKNTGVIAAGLALFSMFFGAGDLIWPLILGGQTGNTTFYSMLGLLITGVSLPLIGCLAMMLFRGDYRKFFGRLGVVPGFCILFLVQAILGPFGSIPRLITLSYATLKPYLFDSIGPMVFSILACAIVFLFLSKKQKLIDILGYVLTPILLLALAALFILGYLNAPEPLTMGFSNQEAFFEGIKVGYNTLDIIASFIFAAFVMTYFLRKGEDMENPTEKRKIFGKMLKSSLLAAALLAGMYIGLTHIAASYTPLLPAGHAPEERLALVSLHLLGPYGGFVSCIAVTMACLTTAISITAVVSDYIRTDLLKGRGGQNLPIFITLGISALLANIGFMGIANMLAPILTILCPGLIVLSILNILHQLYEMKLKKISVFAAFAVTTLLGLWIL